MLVGAGLTDHGDPGPAWTANPGGKAQEPENPRTRSQDTNLVPLARVLRYAFCMSQPPSVLTAPRLWDLVADGYSREIAPHLAKYADDALRLAEVGPGQLIADVACGPGALSLSAARGGARVFAIDFSPEMIARLREQCVREGVVSIDARVGDGMKLPYDNASVDCTFSMFGLMFFPQLPAAGSRWSACSTEAVIRFTPQTRRSREPSCPSPTLP
jgi:SAM-dependent methyltransferase